MNNMEMLSLLNSISYTEDEIQDLESKAIEKENTIGKQLYKIKNDKTLRKLKIIELTQKVIGKCKEDETLKFKAIFLQSYLQKEINAQWVGILGSEPVIYLSVFITNKRVFIFRMNREYKELDEPYIYNIISLDMIIDRWDECKTLVLKFKDKQEVSLRPYGNEEERLLFFMIKYLKESQGLDVIPYKKTKTIGEIILIAIIISLMVIMGLFLINVILQVMKDILG